MRSVDGYHLTLRKSNWYLVGFCHLRQALRTFVVHRIRKVQVEDRAYKIPPHFNVDSHFKLPSAWSSPAQRRK